MVLLHYLILLFQKVLQQVQHTILLRKLQTNKSFNKSHLIIHQRLILKTSWIFMKNACQNHILFQRLMLPLHQIILNVDQSPFMEQAKFIYSPLGKYLEKQTKTTENKAKNKSKQLKTESKNNFLIQIKNQLLLGFQRTL